MSKSLIAYSKLLSLRQNIPESLDIEEYFVRQYHEMLDSIKDALGEDVVTEFRLEESEIDHIESLGNYVTGETYISDQKYCDRHKLLSKIDALLNYIKLQSSDEERKKMTGLRI